MIISYFFYSMLWLLSGVITLVIVHGVWPKDEKGTKVISVLRNNRLWKITMPLAGYFLLVKGVGMLILGLVG